MVTSPDIEFCQQHGAAGLGVFGDFEGVDDAVSFLAGVFELDLLTWPAAVAANALGDSPFERLAGLGAAHDDGVVAFEALA
ncbi:hypothetical protein D3C86_2048940 [compost metagenome]